MLLGVFGANHRHAGDQLGVADLVPLLGEVQGHPQGVILHGGGGHIGLGQHSDGILGHGHLGGDLGGLAVELDGHILVGINAVLLQDVPQDVLGGGALAGGQDGPALQVGHRMDGVTLFHHIQDAQGVDGHHLDAALGLLVEGGGQVGRDGSHIQLALGQQGDNLVGGAVELQVIVQRGGAVLLHGQQVHQAHGGGALQAGDPHSVGGGQGLSAFGRSGLAGGSLAGSSLAGCCGAARRGAAAGCQGQHQGCRQQQGNQFLHDIVPSSPKFFTILKNCTKPFALQGSFYYNEGEITVACATEQRV